MDNNVTDHIDYNDLMTTALRSVIKGALQVIEKYDTDTPPHAMYISFATDHPRAQVPDFLKRKFPSQMTIALENQYEGLKTDDDGFNVTLKFGGIPASLRVPFDAIHSFQDQKADNFGFQLPPRYPTTSEPDPQRPPHQPTPGGDPTVVSLDAFRRK